MARRTPRRTAPDDQGVALVIVVGAMAVLTALLLTTLAFTMQTATSTRRDQDAKTAIAAAQAGIDEYVSRLTANDNYWATTDAGNAAFGTGATIQGTAGAGATYTYTVLSSASDIAATGRIKLRVTGTSSPGNGTAPVKRSMVATLKVRGFLSYAYLSDIEVVDPDLDFTSNNAACAAYYYSGRSALTNCSDIQWMSRDTVNGPLHSNDALYINGAVTFLGRTTSAWPYLRTATGSKTWWGSQAGGTLPARSPVYGDPVDLPLSNALLKQYVSPDVDGNTGTPAGPGCYYQGATEIVFEGTSMRVRSPMTDRSDTPTRCLNVADRANWQTISPIPPVIYVDGTTSGGCVTGNTAAFSYPRADESWPTGASATAVSWTNSAGGRIPNYSCTRGSAYVQGTVTGGVTIAGWDDVVVTGNLRVTSLSGSDVIGLVAGNCVWVYHPVDNDRHNLLATPVNHIDAAVLALRHSFLVANWNLGASPGTLNLTGALAQKFRGPVGTGNGTTATTGYLKNYRYDTRLENVQPPYFLKPTTSPWRVVSLVDE